MYNRNRHPIRHRRFQDRKFCCLSLRQRTYRRTQSWRNKNPNHRLCQFSLDNPCRPLALHRPHPRRHRFICYNNWDPVCSRAFQTRCSFLCSAWQKNRLQRHRKGRQSPLRLRRCRKTLQELNLNIFLKRFNYFPH
ncbi:MAG: hypothetical protein BWY69_01260 [Planctomycetes bacterium ADurb.Bin401]|nr:MAG: hypothetical protein BWY69_01260 [Planctomycetes bacterium ADurb.Bin401]